MPEKIIAVCRSFMGSRASKRLYAEKSGADLPWEGRGIPFKETPEGQPQQFSAAFKRWLQQTVTEECALPSGKKPGGQGGHKSSGMAISIPDAEKKCYPSECSGCPMAGRCGYTCAGTHYTYDVEVITNDEAHKYGSLL